MRCILRNAFCTTSSVLDWGDMNSENHNVVIRESDHTV